MPQYSPLLAIATGIFETAAAFFALSSPGRKKILYPAALLLFLLAGYQFAEVAVCSHPGNALFTRLAYFDITWLPPVGLWLLVQIAFPRPRRSRVVPLVYFAAATGLVAWIFLDPSCVSKSVCQLVIARYENAPAFEVVYGVFYQSGLILLIVGAAAGLAKSGDAVSRAHIFNFHLGILGFVLPSLYLRNMLEKSEGAMPSLMCHFALILAVSLAVMVFRERRLKIEN